MNPTCNRLSPLLSDNRTNFQRHVKRRLTDWIDNWTDPCLVNPNPLAVRQAQGKDGVILPLEEKMQ